MPVVEAVSRPPVPEVDQFEQARFGIKGVPNCSYGGVFRNAVYSPYQDQPLAYEGYARFGTFGPYTATRLSFHSDGARFLVIAEPHKAKLDAMVFGAHDLHCTNGNSYREGRGFTPDDREHLRKEINKMSPNALIYLQRIPQMAAYFDLEFVASRAALDYRVDSKGSLVFVAEECKEAAQKVRDEVLPALEKGDRKLAGLLLRSSQYCHPIVFCTGTPKQLRDGDGSKLLDTFKAIQSKVTAGAVDEAAVMARAIGELVPSFEAQRVGIHFEAFGSHPDSY